MWLLHARDDLDCQDAARGESTSLGRGDQGGTGWKPVPLWVLCKDHQCCKEGSRSIFRRSIARSIDVKGRLQRMSVNRRKKTYEASHLRCREWSSYRCS